MTREASPFAMGHTGLTQEIEELNLTGVKQGGDAVGEEQHVNTTLSEDIRLNTMKPSLIDKEATPLSNRPRDGCDTGKQKISTKVTLKLDGCKMSKLPRTEQMINRLVWKETFADILLDDEWVKVEVLKKEDGNDGVYWVKPLDGSERQLKVNMLELKAFGSHEPESDRDIEKRLEFEKLEKLLVKKQCSIATIVEDGNCLFRAAARQLYGDSDKHQDVRVECVEYIIMNKSHFSQFETNIDQRLTEQLLTRT